VTLGAAFVAFAPLGEFSGTGISNLAGVVDAHAKNGHGGGHGNASPGSHGNANPGSQGNASPGNKGRSANSQGAKGRSTGSHGRNGLLGIFAGLGKPAIKGRQNVGSSRQARGLALKQEKMLQAASIPVPAVRPEKAIREKNFHARIAGLNSLTRNYHAYLNANDPRMAAIRDFVLNSVAYEDALAAVEQAQADLAKAMEDFTAITGQIVAYDDFSYENISLEDLQSRLDTLNAVDPASLSDEDAAALETEIAAVEAALTSDEAAAVTAATEVAQTAEDKAGQAASLVTDEALTEALLSAANKNRVAEYGADDYVDQEMLDWAKDVLGVGDAYGKIDEVKGYLDSQDTQQASQLELRDTVTDF
jgi:hypothetical protein